MVTTMLCLKSRKSFEQRMPDQSFSRSFRNALILSSMIEISTSTLRSFPRSISAYSSSVKSFTGLHFALVMRFQMLSLGTSPSIGGAVHLLYACWPAAPKSASMMAPGIALDRPRVSIPTRPPVTPPATLLALVRSRGVNSWSFVVHASRIVVRHAENVLPSANV